MCREYQRGACKRAESECRFAHPADSVTANEDGTVTVCMDAVKGRCNRDPCRYFHPPLHLQAQIKAAQSRASAVCYAVLGRTLAILSFLNVSETVLAAHQNYRKLCFSLHGRSSDSVFLFYVSLANSYLCVSLVVLIFLLFFFFFRFRS